jgi:hypothetical protein
MLAPMTRIVLALSLVLAACSNATERAPDRPTVPAPAAPPAPLTAPPPASAPSACASPEARALDFWVGSWDVVIRSRQAPDSDAWGESRGTNDVKKTMNGCVVEEHFHADSAPGQPAWNGQSVSVYLPATKDWRQTWVDDQGNYLAFTGGPADGKSFVLLGEPKERNGAKFQMRMVFHDIEKDAFSWSWERGAVGGSVFSPMMTIRYTRRR